jgi:serine/threonine protein kinase
MLTTEKLPDFANYGYQVNSELGHNRAGGRVTYLATEINSKNSVVVKQFQFASPGANWSEYQASDRELQVLHQLDHPNIPRYLDSFQTGSGFCLVQEYKKAPSLAEKNDWSPQQIKQIAISVLEILKYLQSQIPPVIHRDLKPENILVDDQMKVTLVDFGFARAGAGEVAVSSVVKGTLGFMPPEQMFNRELTVASDLYSLGATLICLLTKTPSTEVGNLMDEMGRINFKSRVPKLSDRFINWLQKMVEPNYQNRFPSAEVALNALIPIQVLRPITIPKWAWITGGLIAASLAISVPVVLKIMQLEEVTMEPEEVAMEPEEATLQPQLIDNPQVVISTNPEATESLETVKLQQGTVYFRVEIDKIPPKQYQGTCQLFDGVGALVAVGSSTLETASGKLQSWCSYDFSKDADRPGEWNLKFLLEGRQIIEKSFTVSP